MHATPAHGSAHYNNWRKQWQAAGQHSRNMEVPQGKSKWQGASWAGRTRCSAGPTLPIPQQAGCVVHSGRGAALSLFHRFPELVDGPHWPRAARARAGGARRARSRRCARPTNWLQPAFMSSTVSWMRSTQSGVDRCRPADAAGAGAGRGNVSTPLLRPGQRIACRVCKTGRQGEAEHGRRPAAQPHPHADLRSQRAGRRPPPPSLPPAAR